MDEVEIVCLLLDLEKFTQELANRAEVLGWDRQYIDRVAYLDLWIFSIRRDVEDGRYRS